MKTLLINTTNNLINIVLKIDEYIDIKEQISVMNHSTYVMTMIKDICQQNNIEIKQLDKIIVINGPGSFTGIRIGVVIAKTLAYLENISITTISSLQAASINYKSVIILIHDNNDKYYYGIYKNNLILEEGLDTLENIKNKQNIYNIEQVIENNLKYDFNNIINYGINKENINPHQVNPYYLKKTTAEESLIHNDN